MLEKALQYKDELSCLMVIIHRLTVSFESAIREIIQIIHDNGGLVLYGWSKYECSSWINKSCYYWSRCLSFEFTQNICTPHGGGVQELDQSVLTKKLVPFLPVIPVVGGDQATVILWRTIRFGFSLFNSYGYLYAWRRRNYECVQNMQF
jgi:glycine dehydrogenase